MFFPGTLTANRARPSLVGDDSRQLGIMRGFPVTRVNEETIWLQVYIE